MKLVLVDRRPHICVIRPGSVIKPKTLDTLADVTYPGRGDLVLNITAVPGEALTRSRRNKCARRLRLAHRSARREEEPIRVGEGREGRRAERIACDHMQRLHLHMVRKRHHNVVLNQASVRVQPV